MMVQINPDIFHYHWDLLSTMAIKAHCFGFVQCVSHICPVRLLSLSFPSLASRCIRGRHGKVRGRLKDYKNTAMAGAGFRIRKNVTNKHTENPQTDIEFNYRGHSIAVPMERRVERANISTWSESAENSIKKNIVDPCFHMTKVSALLLSSILGLLWS